MALSVEYEYLSPVRETNHVFGINDKSTLPYSTSTIYPSFDVNISVNNAVDDALCFGDIAILSGKQDRSEVV